MDDFVGKGELLRRLHNGYKDFNEGIKRLSPEQMEIPGVNGMCYFLKNTNTMLFAYHGLHKEG
jgi:hypothetical protein